jgi:EmrB/QacA subfamily drug resistance transporter
MNEIRLAESAGTAVRGTQRGTSARGVLAGLSLSMLLSALGTSIANVGLPAIATAFDASFQQVQWIVLAYLLAITTLVVSVGRLGDLVGRRRLLLAGISLFTVASLLCAASATLWMLVLARALQGAGAAVMMALCMAFVRETVAKERTGGAMGLLGTMSAVGTALGPTLGGVLISGFGWQALFFINIPLGILAFALAARYLPVDRPATSSDRNRFDFVGTLLIALTLAAYALAMTTGRGSFGVVNFGLLIIAIVTAGLFALLQMKSASPLVQLGLFRNPVLSSGFAMSFLVTTVVMTTLVISPFYLSGTLALDTMQIGLVMSSGPIVAALAGVPSGRIVDRFGTRRMTLAGLVGMTVGAVMLAVLPTSLGVPGYVGPLVILTGGYALFQGANNTAVLQDIASDQRGLVSGLLNLSRNLGLITGASLMGAVFALGSTPSRSLSAPEDAIASGMRITFALAASLIAVAIGICLTTWNRSSRAT